MFGFFKKKGGEIPEEQQRQQRGAQEGQTRQDAAEVPQEFRALGQDFLPEELNILAVTGASGFGGGRSQGEKLWTASIGLTAWMEEDSPDIHQGDFRLVALADDRLMDYLRQRVPRDFIIKCRARLSVDGSRLLMLELPQPGFDPDLKAILDEQKKPVTFWVDGLGTFALNRALGWFEAEADWLGSPIRLDLDRDEDREKCLFYLRALMKGQADWDGRLRACAARDLLERANDWASDGGCEEHEPEEITREQFMERLEPDAVQISGDGSFDFWFNDGALFWGHSIHAVSYTHLTLPTKA